MPVTADAGLLARGLAERLAEADAHVLDRVMLIDVQIARRIDFQIEGCMLCQQC